MGGGGEEGVQFVNRLGFPDYFSRQKKKKKKKKKTKKRKTRITIITISIQLHETKPRSYEKLLLFLLSIFFLLINVKMLTIVGILTFMCRKHSILGLSEPDKKLNFLIFLYFRAFKISCSADLSMR